MTEGGFGHRERLRPLEAKWEPRRQWQDRPKSGALLEDAREATAEAIPGAIGTDATGATAGNRVVNGT